MSALSFASDSVSACCKLLAVAAITRLQVPIIAGCRWDAAIEACAAGR